jgi:hypothetical protein
MVNKAISKDVRERVIWLVEHGYAPPDICEFFGISDRTLRRWRKNNDTYGSPIPPPVLQRGRPHILNNDMTHDLYTLIEEAPDMYLVSGDAGHPLSVCSHLVSQSRDPVVVRPVQNQRFCTLLSY